jgi:chromosome segregation ATPase
MHGKNLKYAAGFTLAALFLALPARAQQQDSQPQSDTSDSVAAAARKAKEEKKDNPKPKRVYTEDDISTKKSDVSVVGNPAPPTDATATPDTTPTAAAKGTLTPEQKWRQAFAAQRAKIAQAEKELDVLQREESKAGLQYYSDPTKAMKEQLTRNEINEKAAKIAAKKQQIADLKQQMDDMEDQLRKEGGDPGWAR